MSERVLETDFPLMVPPNPPSVGGVRTSASPAVPSSNTSSLSRQQPNLPPAYNSGSRSSHAPSNAIPGYSYGRHSHHGAGTGSDWQYRGSSMTRTVTATSNFFPQPVSVGAANPAIGRSGSLKKAYSDGRSRKAKKRRQFSPLEKLQSDEIYFALGRL